ncbi:MAG TPA: hypothetical protein VH110_05245 [Candidatus Acidoferrum sp.]|jgi:hypothetical protein|nr:hypothetical protein [Candidatus Acidoferrum sp.]
MKTENVNLAQLGIAALLPGIQYVIGEVEKMLAELKADYAMLANIENAASAPRRGRPRNTKLGYRSLAGLKPGTDNYREALRENKRMERARKGNGKSHRGWSDSPEERSAEMKRRQAVVRAKGKKSAAQTHWDGMSSRQKKQFLAKMAAGRAAKKAAAQHVNGAAA